MKKLTVLNNEKISSEDTSDTKINNRLSNMLAGRKLSKQQKAILEYLIEIKGWYCKIRDLSWYIAKKFDVNGNRIFRFNLNEHKTKLYNEYKDKEENLSEKEKVDELTRLNWTFYLVDGIYSRKPEFEKLTNLHKASFYRSIKRLVKRGYVVCFDELEIDPDYWKEYKKIRWIVYAERSSYYKYIMPSTTYTNSITIIKDEYYWQNHLDEMVNFLEEKLKKEREK